MRALVRDEFATCGLGSDESAEKRKLRASGPDLQLPPAAAQSLALVLHELTTNAIKYGALSAAGGWVSLEWKIEDEAGARSLLVEWGEQAGPPVRLPERQGFGTSLIANSIKHQLSGTINIDWQPTGLRVSLVVPLDGQMAG